MPPRESVVHFRGRDFLRPEADVMHRGFQEDYLASEPVRQLVAEWLRLALRIDVPVQTLAPTIDERHTPASRPAVVVAVGGDRAAGRFDFAEAGA